MNSNTYSSNLYFDAFDDGKWKDWGNDGGQQWGDGKYWDKDWGNDGGQDWGNDGGQHWEDWNSSGKSWRQGQWQSEWVEPAH